MRMKAFHKMCDLLGLNHYMVNVMPVTRVDRQKVENRVFLVVSGGGRGKHLEKENISSVEEKNRIGEEGTY